MNITIPRQAIGFGLGVLACSLFLGALNWVQASPQEEKVPKVIRAQRFELVDDKGILHAILAREKGVTFLSLSEGGGGGGKEVRGEITLGVLSDGSTNILLVKPKDKAAISLRLGSDGKPILSLTGKDGKQRDLEPE